MAPELSQQETLPNAPQYNSELIDSERLKKLEGAVGNEIFVEIAELFVTDAKKGMKEILSAFETQSCPQIANKSHAMKSSAATLGCVTLAKLLQEIELETKEENLERLCPMITRLESLMEASLNALSQCALSR